MSRRYLQLTPCSFGKTLLLVAYTPPSQRRYFCHLFQFMAKKSNALLKAGCNQYTLLCHPSNIYIAGFTMGLSRTFFVANGMVFPCYLVILMSNKVERANLAGICEHFCGSHCKACYLSQVLCITMRC